MKVSESSQLPASVIVYKLGKDDLGTRWEGRIFFFDLPLNNYPSKVASFG